LGRKPFSSSQESMSDAQLVPTNCASSQPHLALLERFLSACEAKDGVPDFWAAAFGMSPQRVIDSMVAHGALEPVPLLEKIGICHTVAELKKILSSRGLKVNGKKAELVQRLLEADPKGMEKLCAHRMILRCTPAASQAVSRWEAEQATAFGTATDDVIAALRNRNFEMAIRAADAFRNNKFEPPVHPAQEAMTIHPAPRSIEERADDLATVFTMRPNIFERLQPEQWECIYLNYAVWQLLGRVAPEKFMPGFADIGVMSSATRMLSSYVIHQRQLARWRELGITHAIWLYANAPCMEDPSHATAANVQRDAAHCSVNGKRYEISKGLFVDGKWTWPGVEEGCKCVARAVLPQLEA